MRFTHIADQSGLRIMLPITYEIAVSRALRLRCPRCGEGSLFRNWFIMYEHCPHCGLRYERAPGYFLGSAYINYGFMAITLTVMYMSLHFGAELSNQALTPPLAIYCVVVPLILFRYARSWWLAMDCYFDPTGFSETEHESEVDIRPSTSATSQTK